MEQRNLEKALDVYAALITGQEISRSNPDTRDLYEEFYANAAVYDIVTKMMKKLNLNLYEYQDAVYLTAGEGNRVFGYTNDDMKRLLGLRLNRELYMVYFIMYNFLLLFYQDSASYQVKEYVRLEDILEQVTTYLASITKDLSCLLYTSTASGRYGSWGWKAADTSMKRHRRKQSASLDLQSDAPIQIVRRTADSQKALPKYRRKSAVR